MRKINEDNIEAVLKNMIERTKGTYITQGVSFNKTCPRQMSLLKDSLLASASFSGLAKEALALRFNKTVGGFFVPQQYVDPHEPEQELDESILLDNAQDWV